MKRLVILLFLFTGYSGFSQDIEFGKKIVDTLTSPFFWGRGYTNDGMKKAADFLSSQFKLYGLQPMKGNSFLQSFSYPANTFPGRMEVTINGKELTPGKDYIISPESRGIKGKDNLEQVDSVQFLNRENRLIVKLEDKLTWSVAPEQADYTVIQLDKKALGGLPGSFDVNIENKLVKNFTDEKVCKVTVYVS